MINLAKNNTNVNLTLFPLQARLVCNGMWLEYAELEKEEEDTKEYFAEQMRATAGTSCFHYVREARERALEGIKVQKQALELAIKQLMEQL